MNIMTFTKAWVAGIAAPVFNWLVGMLAAMWAMPDEVSVALVGLLTAAVVYFAPANRTE